MGAGLSSSQNPSSTTYTLNMSTSPPNPQNPDPKSSENQNPDPKIVESQNPETSSQPINPDEKGGVDGEERENGGEVEGEGEEEEEGECGFCLFMKAGGCKDEFVAWEKCVEDSEKNQEDIVEKCFEVTGNLKKCMLAHSDYYEPLLKAEKAAEEEVKQEMEREAAAEAGAKKNGEQDSDSKAVEETGQTAEVEVTMEG